jgi:hypothetical protein
MQPMVDSDRLKNQAKVQCNSVIRDDNGVIECEIIMTYWWMVLKGSRTITGKTLVTVGLLC